MADRNEDGTFAPGTSGNAAGRPPMPPDIRRIQKLKPNYLKEIIAKISRMDPAELLEWTQRPMREGGPNVLEATIASIYARAGRTGDHTALNFLLDRSIGKVVEDKRVQLQPVTYKTTIRADGALVQEVLEAEILGTKE